MSNAFEELRVSRGAQADAFAIEAPARTVAHVKAFRDCERYAHLFAAAPDLLVALCAAYPLALAQAESEHMMDGFGGRKPRPGDALVEQIKSAISKASP